MALAVTVERLVASQMLAFAKRMSRVQVSLLWIAGIW